MASVILVATMIVVDGVETARGSTQVSWWFNWIPHEMGRAKNSIHPIYQWITWEINLYATVFTRQDTISFSKLLCRMAIGEILDLSKVNKIRVWIARILPNCELDNFYTKYSGQNDFSTNTIAIYSNSLWNSERNSYFYVEDAGHYWRVKSEGNFRPSIFWNRLKSFLIFR